MAEYIEREEALEALMYAMCGTGFQATAMMEVRRIPAADVAPVVHGRWIDNGIPGSMLSVCPECGFTFGAYSFKYRHNCGAKMDKEDADGMEGT